MKNVFNYERFMELRKVNKTKAQEYKDNCFNKNNIVKNDTQNREVEDLLGTKTKQEENIRKETTEEIRELDEEIKVNYGKKDKKIK